MKTITDPGSASAPQWRSFTSVESLVLAILTLLILSPTVNAEDNSINISPAEFQRMIYAGHLLAQMDERPELDASLQVLLELQRRNPSADPVELADLLRDATARYRTNAAACFRDSEWRDEILVAYLDAFRQDPRHFSYNDATFALINSVIGQLNVPATMQQSQLLNSGFERLLNAEGKYEQRRLLVDASVRRAASNAVFRRAMDRLLLSEIGFSVIAAPAQIINGTDSLSNNPTFQALLSFSQTNLTGGLEISLTQLKQLFLAETKVIQETVATNISVDLEIGRRQSDALHYMGNQEETDLRRESELQHLQAIKISAAHASFSILSSLADYRDNELGKGMKTVGDALANVGQGIGMLSKSGGLNMFGGYSLLISAGLGIFGLVTDSGPSPDEVIIEGINDVKNMIRDFSEHMDYRFDRVDQTLITVYTNLSARLDRIDAITGKISDNVTAIRTELLVTQNDLHRLERELFGYLDAGFRRPLVEVINGSLAYEKTRGQMAYLTYIATPDGPENIFYSWAWSHAKDELSSPKTFADADFADNVLSAKLNSLPLESSLNYLDKFVSTRFKLQRFGTDLSPLANPRDWFVSAQAYLQLAIENPQHFRRLTGVARVNDIISNGTALEGFFRHLLFTGTGSNVKINATLYDALLQHYSTNLNMFIDKVDSIQNEYAAANGFPRAKTWQQWDLSVARVMPSASTVQRIPPNPSNVYRIAAGSSHALALRKDGTLVGWGSNNFGQVSIPTDATHIVAVAAKHNLSLAIKNDGTVVAFGSGTSGLMSVPKGLSKVTAVATSGLHCLAVSNGMVVAWGSSGHNVLAVPAGITDAVAVAAADEDRDATSSLALKADGTVMAWGTPTAVPPGLRNVIAIAAGDTHYLALQSNGTVVTWGYLNWSGVTPVPAGLSNVIAIAAGEYHSLALKADGRIAAWGPDKYGPYDIPADLTNVVAIAASGSESYAVLNDGTVVTLPRTPRSAPAPSGLDNLVTIAAGERHSLAIRKDGTVVGWGYDNHGQAIPNLSFTNIVGVAAGGEHSLALRSNHTIKGWGNDSYGQVNVPASASNVVAIAAGDLHSLALRADGKVVGWGYNWFGEATGVPTTSSPYSAQGILPYSDVVAIAAGIHHNLAIRSDGTVVAWGLNGWYQTNVPAGLTGVVAIAAGTQHSLALKADGTVVAWGYNGYGQGNVPSSATNVVAIASGAEHCLALRNDGTVVGWGDNDVGQATGIIHGPPGPVMVGGQPLANVVAMAAGKDFSCFLCAAGSTAGSGLQGLVMSRGALPFRIAMQLSAINEFIIPKLSAIELNTELVRLSGSKALLQDILELTMPYTMERDDILHGFVYGSESLADPSIAYALLVAETNRLHSAPAATPIALQQVARTRFTRFGERLSARLFDIGESGTPEIPRIVGHTTRLLYLLRDAQGTLPPPAVELDRASGVVQLVSYGEPFAHYPMQYSEMLSQSGWTTITNLHNGEFISRATAVPREFYRAVLLPVP